MNLFKDLLKHMNPSIYKSTNIIFNNNIKRQGTINHQRMDIPTHTTTTTGTPSQGQRE